LSAKAVKIFSRGIIAENPVFRLVLGMCPVLAVTTLAKSGFGMGISTLAVLTASNIVISMIRNFIPPKIRIPCFIVVIATFVTIIDMVLLAYFEPLHRELGVFIPLIVVNCIILGRAEAFASKNNVFMLPWTAWAWALVLP
jgi:Na+-translocating ferredoxin:NAD+ oxidoreductase subunit E